MALVVQKYGGTSVGDAERIRAVADHVARTREAGNDVVVVVSAMGKFTDDLIRLADDVSPTRPPRELDMLLTAGERISMALVSMALGALGREAGSFTGSQAGIITDTDHTRAKIVEMRPERIREALDAGLIPSSRASRASRPSGTSRRSVAEAPTSPRWRWRRRSRPTYARSTPT